MLPPFAAPGSKPTARRVDVETLPSIQDFVDELPSIEELIDYTPIELPPIAKFVVDEYAAEVPEKSHDADWFHQEEYDADGWAVSGWQEFDWDQAAFLGARTQATDEAKSAWDTIDWTVPAGPSQPQSRTESAPPSADEVARALDGIARRIRSGELVIDQSRGTPPEAAMAAALAALLRMRD